MLRSHSIVALLSLTIVGCGATPLPDVAALYSRAAQEHDDDRNPVIVIPGILGSRLMAGDQVVWGAFGGGSADPEDPDGARLIALPLVRHEGESITSQSDDVRSTAALDQVEVTLFGLINVRQRAYRNILLTLGAGMYRDQDLGEAGAVDYGTDHYTCFQFHYDWRRDLVWNARQFKAFIGEARAKVREHRPHGKIKFDLVAHSMGGLLARYFLRYGDQELPADGGLPALTWQGAADVERLIMIGTPNAGSAVAIQQLVNGFQPAPLLPTYDPVVLGSFPSIFQLLPRARHGPVLVDGKPTDRLFDVSFWIEHEWGLANPEYDGTLEILLPDVRDASERRRIALSHLCQSLARAEQFHRALDVPAATPSGVDIHLFAGDAIDTTAVVTPGGDRDARVVSRGAGDGTVLRSSTFMDERVGATWSRQLRTPIDFASVRLLYTDHLAMTQDPIFTDNVLYLLLEDPRRSPVAR